MKIFVLFSCLVAMAWCGVLPESEQLRRLPAVRHEEVRDAHGQYAIRYITAENTVVSERGYFVEGAEGGRVLQIEGQYQFVGDDGQIYVTKYVGGPNGFKVDGTHLPVQTPLVV